MTWNRSITGTASGSSSPAAVLKPVNPSIATTSTPSRHARGRPASHCMNTALERPSTMFSSLAGPVLSRTGVRSMITVTYRSPNLLWRQTCSSTPIVVTRSNRAGSSIRRRRPSAMIAAFAVFHETPRPAAGRETVRWSTTIPSNAHAGPPREIFDRAGAAALVACPRVRAQCEQEHRRTRTSNVVGR